MIYLLQWYWGWLLLTLILGGLVGFYTFEREFNPPTENRLWWLPTWFRWVLAIFVFGCTVTIMRWFPGRLAFYLETALLFFAFYLIGCFLGGLLPELLHRRHAAQAEPNRPVPVTPPGGAKTLVPAETPTDVASPKQVSPGPVSVSTALSAATTESSSAGDTTIDYPGKMPSAATESETTSADDLKLIKGVGPVNEGVLHDLGIFRFSQIAAWTPEEITWVEHRFAFPGRIERERWVEQAALLAAGVETEHSLAVRRKQVVPQDDAVPEEELAQLNLPRTSPPRANEAEHAGKRPLGLAQPATSMPDDLKRISGIGPVNEQRLHELGIWHFAQIAAWTPENIQWVGSYLAFPGRIEREHWMQQARDLTREAASNETQA